MLEITIAVAHAFEGKERYYVKETRDGYSLEYRQLAYSLSVTSHSFDIYRLELATVMQRLLDFKRQRGALPCLGWTAVNIIGNRQ